MMITRENVPTIASSTLVLGDPVVVQGQPASPSVRARIGYAIPHGRVIAVILDRATELHQSLNLKSALLYALMSISWIFNLMDAWTNAYLADIITLVFLSVLIILPMVLDNVSKMIINKSIFPNRMLCIQPCLPLTLGTVLMCINSAKLHNEGPSPFRIATLVLNFLIMIIGYRDSKAYLSENSELIERFSSRTRSCLSFFCAHCKRPPRADETPTQEEVTMT